MWELLTGAIGLAGVLVGALLVSILERRNWQRQELMKGYVELFQLGTDIVHLVTDLHLRLHVLNETLDQNQLQTIEDARTGDPQLGAAFDIIENDLGNNLRIVDDQLRQWITQGRIAPPARIFNSLFDTLHDRFIQAFRKCELLERDLDTRRIIIQAETSYHRSRQLLRMLYIRLIDNGRAAIDRGLTALGNEALPQTMAERLRALQIEVEVKHFHGGDQQNPDRTERE